MNLVEEGGCRLSDLELLRSLITSGRRPPIYEGKLVTPGRRVAFAKARLCDADDRLCASASSTLLVFAL